MNMHDNSEISSEHDRSTVVPVIPLHCGYPSLTAGNPVRPALQIHPTATDRVGKMLRNSGIRNSIVSDLPSFKEYRTLTEVLDHRHVVADEKNGSAVHCSYIIHLADAFFLKIGISNSQDLVHNQDFGLEVRRDRKREADIHTR